MTDATITKVADIVADITIEEGIVIITEGITIEDTEITEKIIEKITEITKKIIEKITEITEKIRGITEKIRKITEDKSSFTPTISWECI